MDNKAILSSSMLFQGLPEADLEEITSLAICKKFSTGERIFSEGREAEGFYIVAKGRVKIFKLSREGKEHILHIVNPPNPFAEAAVFSGKRYPAYAEAIETSEVLFFDKSEFVNLIKQQPQLALNMLGALSLLLREFNLTIEELSLKEVSSRLARYVCDLAMKEAGAIEDGNTLKLDISKAQLAARLGTISETLSRTLRKFADRNILKISGRRVTIINAEALTEIGHGEKL